VILRLSLILIAAVFVAGVALWFFGPREPADLTVHFDAAAIGTDPDRYLARTEADVPNLRPADAKEIVWAYPASRAKTPLAVVYIHGFSASKEEMRPLPDEVAKALGANLFLTRLSGHGRDGVALARTNVNEWINDLAEAVAVGRTIGERVIVVANSTGGTLATLGASRLGLMDGVAGLVLLSPNYRLLDRWAFLLDWPFARDFGPRLMGAERSFTPSNTAQAEHWTTRYPTTALLPLGALLRETRKVRPAGMTIPAFFLYSPGDRLVDPAATEAMAAGWGASHQALQVPSSDDPLNHVLAGRILSPDTTDEIAARIVDWVRALGK
jgi:pimeloyl-ACP methyl ester carboxylesterase